MTNKDFSCKLQESSGAVVPDVWCSTRAVLNIVRTTERHCCTAVARRNGENGGPAKGDDVHGIQIPLSRDSTLILPKFNKYSTRWNSWAFSLTCFYKGKYEHLVYILSFTFGEFDNHGTQWRTIFKITWIKLILSFTAKEYTRKTVQLKCLLKASDQWKILCVLSFHQLHLEHV